MKEKLTSRKFWMSVVSFVTMLLIYLGKDSGEAEQIASLICAGATVIGYVIGEGLADSSTEKNYIESTPIWSDSDDSQKSPEED